MDFGKAEIYAPHDFYYDASVRKPLGMFFPFIVTGGLFLEFGVFRGASIRYIARKVPSEIVYGFDSFHGLPEAWGDTPCGAFGCTPPKDIPDNVRLVIGLFQDTLPHFLASHPEQNVSFVHIDCDLYSSAKFVLNELHDRLDGAIVVFDEIVGLPVCEDHEGKAFKEFLAETGYKAEFLGHHHRHGAGYRMKRG